MSAGHPGWARRLLDLVAYAVGLTAAVAVGALVPSLLVGAGLVGVKFGLFAVGVLAFGYATVLHWPSPPGEAAGGGSGGRGPIPDRAGPDPAGVEEGQDHRREETRFEAVVGRAPPLSWYDVPPVDRFHPGTKLYVASVLMLAVSYALEVVLGVRA